MQQPPKLPRPGERGNRMWRVQKRASLEDKVTAVFQRRFCGVWFDWIPVGNHKNWIQNRIVDLIEELQIQNQLLSQADEIEKETMKWVDANPGIMPGTSKPFSGARLRKQGYVHPRADEFKRIKSSLEAFKTGNMRRSFREIGKRLKENAKDQKYSAYYPKGMSPPDLRKVGMDPDHTIAYIPEGQKGKGKGNQSDGQSKADRKRANAQAHFDKHGTWPKGYDPDTNTYHQ